jgi:ABC-type glycerol-3-phosphate transport system substrate-binding protein
MMTSGIWHTPKFLGAKDLEWDVTTFPKGPKGQKGWSSGGSGYGLVKTSKNKDLAWEVIKEITSAQTLAKLATTGMIQPALIKVAESEAFLKAPGAAHKSVLLKMPQHSTYAPFLPNWNEIYYGVLTPEFDRFWNGDKEPKDVLPGLTKRVNDKYFKKDVAP